MQDCTNTAEDRELFLGCAKELLLQMISDIEISDEDRVLESYKPAEGT